jgi:hypothetical protein
MARFCVATGYTPQQFWEMNYEEVSYIMEELRRTNG